MAAHKEVVEFIQEYFRDELDGTIDSCAREAANCNVPASKDLIVSVRRDMQEEIKKLRNSKTVEEIKRPPPLYIVKQRPLPKIQVPVPEEEKSQTVPIETRRSYYDDILLESPAIGIGRAMKKVTEKYGRSVDVGYALSRLRMVREMAGLQTPKPPETAPEPERSTVAEKPAEDGECLIRYTKQGTEVLKVVAMRKLSDELSSIMSTGIQASAIKVSSLKELKLKLKVSIDFE